MSETERNAKLEGLLIRASRWMWLVVILLLAGGVLQYRAFQRQADQQRTAQFQECLRVQALRELTVNLNGTRQHDEDILVAGVLVQPSLLRSLSPRDRHQRVIAAQALTRFAGALERAARTDCKRAVYHPPYTPPKPVPLGSHPVLRPFPPGF